MEGETTILHADDLDKWVEFYEKAGAPGVYHHPQYLALLAGDYEFEDERAELFVYEDGENMVYYPYLRRALSTSPLGSNDDVDTTGYDDIVSSWYYGGPFLSPGTDDEVAGEFADKFTEYCRESGIVAEFVRFDPNEQNYADFECIEPEFNRETVPVDLTVSSEEVWERYEERNQRAIKQAQETDLVVEPTADRDDIAGFHDIYTNAMEARDAATHYRFDQSFFESLIDSDLFTLLVVRYQDELVGGFIAAHDDHAGYHYLSASNPDYWDMRVNNLLYHEVIMHMKETDRDLFDFQGGRPGVFKFKRGFSPDRGEFYVGKRVHDEEAYDRFLDVVPDDVDTDSGYFPAYRVEQSN